MNSPVVPRLKSLCCNANVRTTFDNMTVVEMYLDGTYKEVNDFVDSDTCSDYFWCKECGGEVSLVWNQEEKKYFLTTSAEMTFSNWDCVYIK